MYTSNGTDSMSLKKSVVWGLVIIALACIAAGKPEIGGAIGVGLVGFLKSDAE